MKRLNHLIEISVFNRLHQLGNSDASWFSSESLYKVNVKLYSQSLFLYPSCVPEKVGINQKLYSRQK